MAERLRVCLVAGCPELTSRKTGRCDTHEAERHKQRDSLRPSTTERGYGSRHQHEHAAIKTRMKRCETFHCARCGQPILPGQDWDLDHTDDRTGYLGPSHASCNRATRRSTTPG